LFGVCDPEPRAEGGWSVTRRETIAAVRSAAQDAAAAGELPIFLAELERVRVEAVLAIAAPREERSAVKGSGRVLSVDEAAARLGRSRWWIYRHKATLPITRFPTGGFGFDERRLERWIENRTKDRTNHDPFTSTT